MTIYSSPHPEPSLPRQSVFSYLFDDAASGSCPTTDTSAPAFIDAITGRSVSQADIRSQALRLASGLRRAGMKRGDVACIVGWNSLEWLNAVYGCQAAGIRVSPASYGHTPSELLYQLSNSQSSMIFISPDLVPTLLAALELGKSQNYELDARRIVLLCQVEFRPSKLSKYSCISGVWGDEGSPEVFQNGDEQETAYLCYSSGTTGLAKGVETTHYNMTSQVQAFNIAYQRLKKGKDVILAFLPFAHAYALQLVVHQPLTSGIPVVILPKFDTIPVLKAIQKYKVTWAPIVPPIVITLAQHPDVDKYDISSFRGAISAAAPLGGDLIDAVQKRLPNLTITQAYGLTETSPISHCMTIEEARIKPGSIGRLIPTFQARLVADGQDVKTGHGGELWLRGPSVMKGYLRNETATRNTFEGEGDGRWFKTGDVAIVDTDGYFTIVDRIKELIKYKGYQVAPADLEATLLKHPGVADVGVIGINSPEQATELPRAYIVPNKRGMNQTEQSHFQAQVIKWVEGEVANHKRLRGGVVLIDAIPKTPSGKILRKKLRDLAKAEADSLRRNPSGSVRSKL